MQNLVPHSDKLDDTWAFLNEGYMYILNRCRFYKSPLFKTRLLLHEATCMMGGEAAEIFYDKSLFTRQGAVLPITLRLLQGKKSVNTLNGKPHAARKALFMSMMNENSLKLVAKIFLDAADKVVPRWQQESCIVLHESLPEVLGETALRWMGFEPTDDEIKELSAEAFSMVEAAAGLSLFSAYALIRRQRTESWAQKLIHDIRSQKRSVSPDTPLFAIAHFEDPEQGLMSLEAAAQEVINLLRPIVAVGRYITYCALALYQFPHVKRALTMEKELTNFVNEVRRYYPFFPFVAGKVLKYFVWKEHAFHEGDWVLMDLYGTNHDPVYWKDPEEFRPGRFCSGSVQSAFIPQGGGHFSSGHRCPGEAMTVQLMKTATQWLLENIRYSVPPQDLQIDLKQIPTLPKSGFVISNIQRRH